MSRRYTTWSLTLTDEQEYSHSWIDEDGKGHVELDIIRIFKQINDKNALKSGSFNLDNIHLVANVEKYEYTL